MGNLPFITPVVGTQIFVSPPATIFPASRNFKYPPRPVTMTPDLRIRGSGVSNQPNNRAPTERTALVASSTAPSISWPEIWSFSKPYIIPETIRLRIIALTSIGCIIIRKVANLIPPYALKLAVDSLTDNLVTGSSIVPYYAILLFTVSRLFQSLFNGLQDYCYSHVSVHATKRFSVDMFQHLHDLSLSFHLQRKTGEITRVMDRGVTSVDNLTSTFLFTLFPTILEAVLVSVIFLRLGTPAIAISTVATVITYFVFTIAFTSWRIRIRRLVIDADNKVSTKAVDTLMNYETVKMFGMERESVDEYRDLQSIYQDVYIKLRLTLGSLNFGQSAIQTIGLGIAVLFAAIGAAEGRLSPGDFVLVNTYVLQLFQPLFFLGTSYRQITQAATDLEKCIVLSKEQISVQDVPGAEPLYIEEKDLLAGTAGEVKFDNVSFKYGGNDRGGMGGLKDVSFSVAPGKMVALVGASGAGKSTIMRLLLRFYDVDSGTVSIDNTDVKTVTQTSLRKLVGVVAQDTVLFNTSLRENIAYGKPNATDAEIMHAARSAALGPLIASLPLGLDTVVGERGLRLSGGERQRVGCARCIIKKPVIVLLDEATSSLDTHTEREMQANLREVCRDRTTLVVAHRLSTVMMADEILVLGKNEESGTGSIIERGSHEELLEAGGAYADMWHVQTSLDSEKESSDM